MKKAKILSLCLAAVLLCGCIVGFMVTGVSADEVNTIVWTVVDTVEDPDTQFLTIDGALAAAKELESTTGWGVNQALRIEVEATAKQNFNYSVDGILFNVPTIWRGNRNAENGEIVYGNKLPITIANANFVRVTVQANIACTNDYTFENVNFPTATESEAKMYFYAGSGEVVLNDCYSTGAGSSRGLGYFYPSGDNFTNAAYIGWTAGDVAKIKADNNGLVHSSITYKGSTWTYYSGGMRVVSYSPAEVTDDNYMTVGYAAITEAGKALEEGVSIIPWDCSAEFIYDTATSTQYNSNHYVRAGTSPVQKAILTLKSGLIPGWYGINGAAERWGDIVFNFEGGEARADIYGTYGAATLNGDLTINDSTAIDWVYTTTTTTTDPETGEPVETSTDTTYGYKASRGSSHKWNINGSIAYIVTAGTHETIDFEGLTTNLVADNGLISVAKGVAGTANVAKYYAGFTGVDYTGITLENRFLGGTVGSVGYLGSSTATEAPGRIACTGVTTVKNVVKDGFTCTGNFYSSTSNVGGTDIINEISGGAFKGNVYLGKGYSSYNSVTNNISGGTFAKPVYAGSYNSTTSAGYTIGTVTNNISGGTFNGAFYAGAIRGNITSIKNNIKGGIFNKAFYGAGSPYKTCTTGIGSVENKIEGGTFNDTFYGGYSSAGADAISKIGSITNNIIGGVFNAYFYGGSAGGTDSTVASVENNASGGSFMMSFYGGSAAGTVTSIENNITGGSFPQNGITTASNRFYGGSVAGTVGSVENNISTVIDKYISYGGNANTSDAVVGTITNNLTGAGFDTFYGGSQNGTGTTAIINNVVNSSFSGSFRGGNQIGKVGVVEYVEGTTTVSSFTPATVTNNIYSIEAKEFYPGSNNDTYHSGTTWVHDAYEAVVHTNFILNDADKSGNVTIATMHDVVVEGSSINAVGGDNSFNIKADTKLRFDSITGTLKVDQTEGWKAKDYVVYDGEGDIGDLVMPVHEEGVYGMCIIEDNVLKGTGVDVSGNLVLTERITVRFRFDKEEVDALGKDHFTLAVTLGGVDLTESELMEDGDGYYVDVAGISPSDLKTEIKYSGNFVAEDTIDLETILNKTKVGASDELIALCNAIAALGSDVAADVDPADMNGAYASVSEGVNDYGIVMSDAVGYTIYAEDASAAEKTYTVKVDGNVIDGAQFVTDDYGTHLDIFVKVASADKMMKIEILDGETSVFEMYASVEQIASLYAPEHNGYVLATNMLAYIQAANAYAEVA